MNEGKTRSTEMNFWRRPAGKSKITGNRESYSHCRRYRYNNWNRMDTYRECQMTDYRIKFWYDDYPNEGREGGLDLVGGKESTKKSAKKSWRKASGVIENGNRKTSKTVLTRYIIASKQLQRPAFRTDRCHLRWSHLLLFVFPIFFIFPINQSVRNIGVCGCLGS